MQELILRESQVPVVKKLLEVLDTKQVGIANLPTGAGKSIVNGVCAMEKGGSYGTTTQRLLVDQIKDTFERFTYHGATMGWVVKGRAGYPCPYLRNRPEKPQPYARADGAPCTSKRASYLTDDGRKVKKCPELKEHNCPYFADVKKSKKAYNVFSTFHYWMYGQRKDVEAAAPSMLNSMNLNSTDEDDEEPTTWAWKPMLIIDEAHNLPEVLCDFYKIEITENSYKKEGDFPFEEMMKEVEIAVQDIPASEVEQRSNASLKVVKMTIGNYYMRKFSELEDIEDQMEALENNIVSQNAYDELEERATPLRKTLYQLEFQNSTLGNSNIQWVFTMEKDKRVTWKPYSAAPFVKTMWKTFRNIIFSSATMFNVPLFLKEIGLGEATFEEVLMKSDFPPEQGPIFFPTDFSLNKDNFASMVPVIMGYVEEICKKYPDKKGIVHCHSKPYRELMINYLKEHNSPLLDRVMTHDSMNREENLKQYLDSDEPKVFFTVAMGEGLDLKDDLGRFQIIVKTPYPDLGDPWVALHQKYDGWSWYGAKALIALMQMSGRVVRSKDDWGHTYILDNNAKGLIKRNWRDIKQEWFKERIAAGVKLRDEEIKLKMKAAFGDF